MKQLIISKIKLISAVILIWVFIFSPIPSVFAASPNIVNIGVGIKGKYVVMNSRLLDGFTEKIIEAIESGVPMVFTFEIELRKENTAWVDSLISKNTVRHKIRFDSLKKAYYFSAVSYTHLTLPTKRIV